MKVAIAIDSFKGSLGSMAAGAAAAAGVRRVFPAAECWVRPLADGGEGTVDALVDGLGGRRLRVTVTGPTGTPVEAEYGLLPGETAILEMASAAGITLIPAASRDPQTSTTYGVGEMLSDALRRGARHFIVGIGGSATNDAGAGLLQALGYQLLDAKGEPIPRGGAALSRLARIVSPKKLPGDVRMDDVTFRVACDVTNPLCGVKGASAVFGPQKGATPEMVARLDAALRHFSEVAGDPGLSPGDGAAGGLGYAFRVLLGAELVRGVDLILKETRLEKFVRDADVVITGEGRLDGQTVMGKAPIGVARLAKMYGVRTLAFAGCLGAGVEAVNDAGIDAYFPILGQIMTLDEALAVDRASENLTRTVEQAFRLMKGVMR